MELQQAIKDRRSIRNYKDVDVNQEMVMQLLESARLSPSAKNTQPWKFYVARGELKNNVANLMKEYHKSNPDGTAGMFATAKVIECAPVLILVFKDKSITSDCNDTLSIGAAIQNILLSATELKLGSLWIAATYNVRDEISSLIGTNLELYSAIAIGVANEEPTQRPRKSLTEILINDC